MTTATVLTLDGTRPRPQAAQQSRDGMFTAMAVVGVLGAIGLAGSFENVARVAGQHGMPRPWLLPLGIDGAIAGFTWFELKLAERNQRRAWIGAFTWLLTGVTVALNTLGKTDPWEIVADAALPLLWKASVAAAKTWKKRDVTVDRIPAARWLCAPWPTLRLWRRMRVWGISSYEAGLDLERRRALARLIDRYGSLKKAPARKRELYRLIAAASGIDDEEERPATAQATAGTEQVQTVRRGPTSRRRVNSRPGRVTDDQLADRVIRLAAKDPGVLAGWKPMAEALRADGQGVGTTRAQRVLELARARMKETKGAPS